MRLHGQDQVARGVVVLRNGSLVFMGMARGFGLERHGSKTFNILVEQPWSPDDEYSTSFAQVLERSSVSSALAGNCNSASAHMITKAEATCMFQN